MNQLHPNDTVKLAMDACAFGISTALQELGMPKEAADELAIKEAATPAALQAVASKASQGYRAAKGGIGRAYGATKGGLGSGYEAAKGGVGRGYEAAKGGVGRGYEAAKGGVGRGYEAVKGHAGSARDYASNLGTQAQFAASGAKDSAKDIASNVAGKIQAAGAEAGRKAVGAGKAVRDTAMGATGTGKSYGRKLEPWEGSRAHQFGAQNKKAIGAGAVGLGALGGAGAYAASRNKDDDE
jgi:hypothetical protein